MVAQKSTSEGNKFNKVYGNLLLYRYPELLEIRNYYFAKYLAPILSIEIFSIHFLF